MTIIFLILPVAVAVSVAAVLAFVWCTNSGQLDDLATPPLRMLRDETANSDGQARVPTPSATGPRH